MKQINVHEWYTAIRLKTNNATAKEALRLLRVWDSHVSMDSYYDQDVLIRMQEQAEEQGK